ncbi:MAG: hypothetical protein EBQ51_08710 [Verrucomicrobia bacterium]|nr:hypothetical protein [Verrucomicrobiota bacterium]
MSNAAIKELLSIAISQDSIATTPAHPRDSARLLHIDRSTGEMTDRTVRDLPSSFPPPTFLCSITRKSSPPA